MIQLTLRATSVLFLIATFGGGVANADDPASNVAAPAPATAPAPSKHQLMKECMRKEKAADSGRENYDLAAECKDITKTEKQNADAEKKADDQDANKG